MSILRKGWPYLIIQARHCWILLLKGESGDTFVIHQAWHLFNLFCIVLFCLKLTGISLGICFHMLAWIQVYCSCPSWFQWLIKRAWLNLQHFEQPAGLWMSQRSPSLDMSMFLFLCQTMSNCSFSSMPWVDPFPLVSSWCCYRAAVGHHATWCLFCREGIKLIMFSTACYS